MKQLKHYKKRVHDLLEKHPKARDNDHTLLAHYVYTHQKSLVHYTADGEPYVKLKDFKKMPPAQTLVNNRKVIQNTEGKFLPTKTEVRKARRIKEKNIRDAEWREAITQPVV